MEPEGSWTGLGFSSESWPYIRDSQLHFTGIGIPSEHLSRGNDTECQGYCGVAMRSSAWYWLTWEDEQKHCLCLGASPGPAAAALLSLLWSHPGRLEQPGADVCSRKGTALLALWVSAVFWLNFAFPPVHLT